MILVIVFWPYISCCEYFNHQWGFSSLFHVQTWEIHPLSYRDPSCRINMGPNPGSLFFLYISHIFLLEQPGCLWISHYAFLEISWPVITKIFVCPFFLSFVRLSVHHFVRSYVRSSVRGFVKNPAWKIFSRNWRKIIQHSAFPRQCCITFILR